MGDRESCKAATTVWRGMEPKRHEIGTAFVALCNHDNREPRHLPGRTAVHELQYLERGGRMTDWVRDSTAEADITTSTSMQGQLDPKPIRPDPSGMDWSIRSASRQLQHSLILIPIGKSILKNLKSNVFLHFKY